MSKLGKFFLILFLIYVWADWGKILFSFCLLLMAGCYVFYRVKGCWPWDILVLTASGKSTASISESTPQVTFKDIGGIDEAKEELQEIIDFLKDKKRYTQVGARLPRGGIMVGPPGVGKTLCARAIAGEAQVPFIEISGSSFVNRYVGVGAHNIRTLFARAKAKAPCIVFIDEFDSLGQRAEESTGGAGNIIRPSTSSWCKWTDFLRI